MDVLVQKLERIEGILQKQLMASQWLSGISQISSYLGLGRTKTSQLLMNRNLKSYRVGKKIMVRKTDLDSFIMFRKPYTKLTRPQKTEVKGETRFQPVGKKVK